MASANVRIGFVMDQIAGHVTNYRNLRAASQGEPDLDTEWHEIHYYKAGGGIERVRERAFPFVSSYVSGIMRGSVEVRRALTAAKDCDAIFTNISIGGFFSRPLSRVPTMIDFDSTPRQIDRMEAYGKSRDPLPLAQLKWRLSRRYMHAATLLKAWSRWARQSAIDEYGVDPEKIVVNPPGVDLGFWCPAAQPSQSRQPFRILFVGGDFRRKGGQLLLDWHREAAGDACELHIVTREAVEAREGVHVYRSMQPNTAELLALYHMCDLFVLPSLGECFGIATVEAMAAGLPVIASDVGGTSDIIEQGRNGFIVAAGDNAALSRGIEQIRSDPVLRRQMASESRLMAEERFDLHKNARRLFADLRRIARSRPALERAPAAT